MKTTFKRFLLEEPMPTARSEEALIASIKDGKFALDGSQLKMTDHRFECSERNLKSLIGAPIKAIDNFYANSNKLTSLVGAPKSIGDVAKKTGVFLCNRNLLRTLEGAPTTVGMDFNCTKNLLTSLEGAPTIIGKNFYCSDNNLTSLKDIHKHIHAVEAAFFGGNPIMSHVLGLLKIKGLREVVLDNKKVEAIINKYLPEGDLFACQQKLIDAGFEDYAKL